MKTPVCRRAHARAQHRIAGEPGERAPPAASMPPGGTRIPLTPSRTTSRQPVTLVVTIGRPAAAASTKVRGSPSRQ